MKVNVQNSFMCINESIMIWALKANNLPELIEILALAIIYFNLSLIIYLHIFQHFKM